MARKIYTKVLGTGSYFSKEVLDNLFFINNGPYKVYLGKDKCGEPIWQTDGNGEIFLQELTEEKILRQTGIEERRWSGRGETTVNMASKALFGALDDAGITPSELKGLICATVSYGPFPNSSPKVAHPGSFPSIACLLQNRIGAKNLIYANDIGAACAGFSFGLILAKELIIHQRISPFAVVAVEMLTEMADYEEYNCDLFGDGAGAMVLGLDDNREQGIISSATASYAGDDRPYWLFRDKYGYLRMPGGPRLLKLAVRSMIDMAEEVKRKACKKLKIRKDEIEKLVKIYNPHQANARIIDGVAKKVGQDMVYRDGIRKYGNVSSATCPIGFDEMRKGKARDNKGNIIKINEGDGIIFTTFGGGPVACANLIIN